MRGLLTRNVAALAMAGAALSACDAPDVASNGRPQLKPDALTAAIAGPDGRTQTARVATRKGEILILGIDGKVVPVPLASREGRRALGQTEAQLARAVAAAPARTAPDTDTAEAELNAQQQLEADFRAQRAPVLPQRDVDTAAPQAGMFLGARVAELQPGQAPQIAGKTRTRGPVQTQARLVEVTANLKQGVDADTAFAYATCALAGWAARNGTPFARHIRTLQQDVDGRLRVASVFTVSTVEPMGLRVVEAQATLGECEARGIPAA